MVSLLGFKVDFNLQSKSNSKVKMYKAVFAVAFAFAITMLFVSKGLIYFSDFLKKILSTLCNLNFFFISLIFFFLQMQCQHRSSAIMAEMVHLFQPVVLTIKHHTLPDLVMRKYMLCYMN